MQDLHLVEGYGDLEDREPDLFISHDGTEVSLAESFVSALQALSGREARIDAFIARGNASARRIKPGDRWREVLIQNLRSSRAVVALLTKRSITRPWVNYELGVADEHEVPVFMLVLDPDNQDLVNHPISDRQWTEPTCSSVAQLMTKLLDHVEAPVDRSADAEELARKFLASAENLVVEQERHEDAEKRHLDDVKRRLAAANLTAHHELREAHRRPEVDYIQHFRARAADVARAAREGLAASLYAVCGDKDWERIDAIYEYMNENVEAARAGVEVHRIYIEPSSKRYPRGFHPCEWQVIACHREWAERLPCFKVTVLMNEEAARARQIISFPPGFGMVITRGSESSVQIHYGMMHEDRRARGFSSPAIVSVYQEIHREMARFPTPEREIAAQIEALGLDRNPRLVYPD